MSHLNPKSELQRYCHSHDKQFPYFVSFKNPSNLWISTAVFENEEFKSKPFARKKDSEFDVATSILCQHTLPLTLTLPLPIEPTVQDNPHVPYPNASHRIGSPRIFSSIYSCSFVNFLYSQIRLRERKVFITAGNGKSSFPIHIKLELNDLPFESDIVVYDTDLNGIDIEIDIPRLFKNEIAQSLQTLVIQLGARTVGMSL